MPVATTNVKHELLEGLTEPQRDAVSHVDGPLLVLAGPGSGKTRVITRRVAYLVRAVGIAPWNVLAITFTNKAAGEMRDRVAKLVSEKQARAITVCTFHSLCARILRTYADRLQLPASYSIYDSDDQERAMKQAIKDLDMNSTNFPPGRVLSTISHAKNELIDPESFARTATDYYSKNVAKLYKSYQAILRKNHALDFDDLLFQTVKVMRDHGDVREQLRQRFRYLLIDEYQDTNHAQFVIANVLAGEKGQGPRAEGRGEGEKGQGRREEGQGEEALADASLDNVPWPQADSAPSALGPSSLGPSTNICATGDPDQSIYRWRGADIRNILEFEEHYPDARVVRLEQNYRSTKRILAVADGLIRHNKRRKHKELWTENDEGQKVRVAVCQDEHAEAKWIVEQFTAAKEREQLSWRDMAIFVRINSLTRVFEDAFRNAGIPYQIARGTAFFDRKEVRDALSYLRIIANPADEVSLLRVINVPARGISDNTVKSLQAYAVAHGGTVADVLRQAARVPGLNARAVASCERFAATLDNWRAAAGLNDSLNDSPVRNEASGDHPTPHTPHPTPSTSLRAFVDQVLRDCGLHDYYLKDSSDPDHERLANLGELVSSAQQFEDDFLGLAAMRFSPDGATIERQLDSDAPLSVKLAAYLEQVSLVSDADIVNAANGAVTLMTLHAAKGLEYPIVAVAGVEDGLLPHSRAQTDEDELEEERRLCFVGVTRAERHLFLTHAKYRTIFGQTQPTIPSRFLGELPGEHVEKIKVKDGGGDVADFLSRGGRGGRGVSRFGRDERRGLRFDHESVDDDGADEFDTVDVAADDAAAEAPTNQPGKIHRGDKVRHPRYGIGTVQSVAKEGHQTRCQVLFNQAGMKTLVLEFAGLERL